jgi:hypothetical protein
MPLKSETATSNRVHPVAWTQCTDAHRARAVTQLPGESSHRTRSIAAITAGSSGSSPSARRARASSVSTIV